MHAGLEPIPNSYASGTAYVYQPINPTTVWFRELTPEEKQDGWGEVDLTSYAFNEALLRDLDTETVRIALTDMTAEGSVNLGVAGTSVKGRSYTLLLDYIKYNTSKRRFCSAYLTQDEDDVPVQEMWSGDIPIYTGIGLRVRAEFRALEAGLDISSLPALAVAASANAISGRLTVQTLGITGVEVTGLIPIISDISVSSIQSAVQAVAAIKSKIYEESTTVYPKIVGFESPSPDPNLIRVLTGKLYAADYFILPVVSTNPETEEPSYHWINWLDQAPDPECEESDQRQARIGQTLD